MNRALRAAPRSERRYVTADPYVTNQANAFCNLMITANVCRPDLISVRDRRHPQRRDCLAGAGGLEPPNGGIIKIHLFRLKFQCSF